MDKQALDAAVNIHSILFSPATNVVGKNGKVTPIKSWGAFNGPAKYRSVNIAGYRFITQNPDKDSKFGRLAQAGVQITWIIRLRDNAWIGKVMDGVLTVLKELNTRSTGGPTRVIHGVKEG